MMRRRSVTVQLMLLAIMPLALLFIALSLFYAHNRNALLDEHFEVRVHDISRGLAASAGQSLLAGDQEALDRLALEMLQDPTIHGVLLSDNMGHPLVRRDHGLSPIEPDALRSVFIPLCMPSSGEGEGQRIGEVWLWFDQTGVLASKRKGGLITAALTIALALLVSGVAWHLSRHILRPLEAVLQSMERIGRGEGGVRVSESAQNELRQLQRGVNLLSGALAEQDRLLERALNSELARERAEQAKAIRTLFLAHMSHEIRTPLNALIGFMQLLRRELSDQPMTLRGQQYLEAMGQSAYHLGELVNDILDFSRMESGKMSLRSTPFTLVRLIDEVAVEMAEQARAKGLFVDVVNFLDLPERVRSDPLRLRQVLINLLSNAIKFTSSGGVVMRAMLGQAPDEHGEGCVLLFEVEDSGSGMPEAARERLLDAFEQLDIGMGREHQGAGLGLAITRGLVELAGGELNIRAVPAGGTMIGFSWPVDWAEEVREPARLPVHARLLDDRTSFRQSLYAKLGRLGWRLHPEGFEPPGGGADIVVLRDPVELGDHGCARLLERVRASQVPHVLICTTRDEPTWERSVEATGATVIRCPATQRDLERAVDGFGLPFISHHRHGARTDTQASLDGRAILVVDDHPLNREMLARMLEYTGARVLQADSGQAALEQEGCETVDAVLLDLHMPGMDGEVVLTRLKERRPALPVFILTADTLEDTVERLRGLGARDVLHKPIAEQQLVQALTALFGQAATDSGPAPSVGDEFARRFRTQEWPAFEARLLRAREDNSPDALREILHTLIGTAGIVGLREIAAAARALETHCMTQPPPPAGHPLWLALWACAGEGGNMQRKEAKT